MTRAEVSAAISQSKRDTIKRLRAETRTARRRKRRGRCTNCGRNEEQARTDYAKFNGHNFRGRAFCAPCLVGGYRVSP